MCCTLPDVPAPFATYSPLVIINVQACVSDNQCGQGCGKCVNGQCSSNTADFQPINTLCPANTQNQCDGAGNCVVSLWAPLCALGWLLTAMTTYCNDSFAPSFEEWEIPALGSQLLASFS